MYEYMTDMYDTYDMYIDIVHTIVCFVDGYILFAIPAISTCVYAQTVDIYHTHTLHGCQY